MAADASLSFITSACAYYETLLAALAAARRSVRVQMYCIEDDAQGRAFQAALIERARAGLRVELMYDSVGSLNTPQSFFDEIAAAGAQVREYHPVNPRAAWPRLSLGRLIRRNHRKMTLIDGETFFVGGMNIGERFLDWADIMVHGHGPETAARLERAFERVWFRRRDPLLARWRARSGSKTAQEVEVLDFSPRFQNYPVKRAYLAAIKRARHRVWIAQAYFIPRRKLLKALARAARNGVDVRLIVPDVSDVRVADLAAWPALARLAKAGVTVMRYHGAMMHAKFAVIDSAWATVGAANLDSMSLYWNLELNLALRRPRDVEKLAAIFNEYEMKSRPVTVAQAAARPWSQRLLSRLLYAYSWIL